jgi:hypothetical protein
VFAAYSRSSYVLAGGEGGLGLFDSTSLLELAYYSIASLLVLGSMAYMHFVTAISLLVTQLKFEC